MIMGKNDAMNAIFLLNGAVNGVLVVAGCLD
jgi:outer membrane murein-binding lipoprotein Lpp